MIGKVGGPGGKDFGRLPTSNSRAKASSPTAKAMMVVFDNMRGDPFLDQEESRGPSGSNAVLHRESFIEATRRRWISHVQQGRIMFMHGKVLASSKMAKELECVIVRDCLHVA